MPNIAPMGESLWQAIDDDAILIIYLDIYCLLSGKIKSKKKNLLLFN
jgi:hypothetical protein